MVEGAMVEEVREVGEMVEGEMEAVGTVEGEVVGMWMMRNSHI